MTHTVEMALVYDQRKLLSYRILEGVVMLNQQSRGCSGKVTSLVNKFSY